MYKALKEYAASSPLPFHMPGHKMGKGIPSGFAESMPLFDVTEIPGTDNLHFPEGPILEAQKLAAEAFGAEETFFLVNGSTTGIHAMILTICNPGDKLIVSRDCHKSVINGMMLARVMPVYIKPHFDSKFGIPTGVLAKEVEDAIRDNPDAVGVLLTRPNYYGVCADIESIASVVHAYGKVLAVDEAHGAHLAFEGSLPKAAMDVGADICVQSAHKTLPALTQGSYLHVRKDRIDIEKLKFYLRMLQTSSPSYLIMASLDMARALMQYEGCRILGRLRQYVERLRHSVDRMHGIKMPQITHFGREMAQDWTRVVLNVEGLGCSGFEAERKLRAEYGIQVEMSDLYNVVCIATVADREEDFTRLMKALDGMDNQLRQIEAESDIKIKKQPGIPEMKIPLSQISRCEKVKVNLKEASGKISLDMLTPYPPGIPVVCPGEVISDDIVDYLLSILESGGTVNGLDGNGRISVVA
ncbi:aminotransferase class I/II-fold pyridoxal phosphate-dependent enzyme [Clostridium thermosuccinogenes]|uniref:aminotransferase class I/II-fold pyridoxal phosphate-dependent enzyme n=1 Tax=Clostridium thermosuccinogenes TaxID=84032 RepID=UPI001FA81E3C|nr:aminotransferase class V-fold PLP-dependent enzyme [Pseudoclostridium thermosuccinogenes]